MAGIEELWRSILGAASQIANSLTDNYILERRLKAALSRPPLFHPNDRRVVTAGGNVPIHLFFPETRGPHGVLQKNQNHLLMASL